MGRRGFFAAGDAGAWVGAEGVGEICGARRSRSPKPSPATKGVVSLGWAFLARASTSAWEMPVARA